MKSYQPSIKYMVYLARRMGIRINRREYQYLKRVHREDNPYNILARTIASKAPWLLAIYHDRINTSSIGIDPTKAYLETARYVLERLAYYNIVTRDEARKIMEKLPIIHEENPVEAARKAAAVIYILINKRTTMKNFYLATRIKITNRLIAEVEDHINKLIKPEDNLITHDTPEDKYSVHLDTENKFLIHEKLEDRDPLHNKSKDKFFSQGLPENIINGSHALEDSNFTRNMPEDTKIKHKIPENVSDIRRRVEDIRNKQYMAEDPFPEQSIPEDNMAARLKPENISDKPIVLEDHMNKQKLHNIEDRKNQQNLPEGDIDKYSLAENDGGRLIPLENNILRQITPEDHAVLQRRPENIINRQGFLEDKDTVHYDPENILIRHESLEDKRIEDISSTQVFPEDEKNTHGNTTQGRVTNHKSIRGHPNEAIDTRGRKRGPFLVWDYVRGEVVNPETGEVIDTIYDYGPTRAWLIEHGILRED